MSTAAQRSTERKPLTAITKQYDRVARLYSTLEPLYLIFPRARRKAVAALNLKPGDVVLEIGAGTGLNFGYLVEAVGPSGTVIGVDASAGMLARARKLVEHRGWSNVVLHQQDAAQISLTVPLTRSFLASATRSYPNPALPSLGPGRRCAQARVVVMDAGLPDSRLGRLLAPIARLLVRLAPGDPYSDPWSDLSTYGSVETERFLLGLYYVSVVEKTPEP